MPVSRARLFLFLLVLIVGSLLVGVLLSPLLLSPRRTEKLAAVWSRSVVVVGGIILGHRAVYENLESLPTGRPFILASKHQSAWETLAFSHVIPGGCLFFKKELVFVPLLGLYMRVWGLPVDRKQLGSVRGLVGRARQKTARGRPLVLFPEGTRTPPGTAYPLKRSVYFLARELGLPVYPAGLNTGLYLPKRWPWYRGTLRVRIGEPLDASVLEKDVFMQRLHAAMNDLSRQLEHQTDA